MAGLALFERRGKKLLLTEAGEHLLRYAQQILGALKGADAALSALKGMRGGRISVGVVSTAIASAGEGAPDPAQGARERGFPGA
jgi:DNA-binding transcriptional LysR family regulator